MMNSSEIMSVMELLQWKEVTTKRQRKNGTREFELPIKYAWGGKIRVASFKAGYVRKQNGGYCAYQINQRIPETVYYKDYEYTDKNGNYVDNPKWTGKYNKYITRSCRLMMDENERLNYLISYCLKNYYIGYANQVADGKFIPKWKHEYELERHDVDREIGELQVIVDGHRYKVI